MKNLTTVEIKAFVPARDFQLSQQFYKDLGFTMASEGSGIAYFHFENCSFLLQDFFEETHSKNFMMHMLVDDVAAWHQHVIDTDIKDKYSIRLSEIKDQPWRIRDFHFDDPSGVLWIIGQNI